MHRPAPAHPFDLRPRTQFRGGAGESEAIHFPGLHTQFSGLRRGEGLDGGDGSERPAADLLDGVAVAVNVGVGGVADDGVGALIKQTHDGKPSLAVNVNDVTADPATTLMRRKIVGVGGENVNPPVQRLF